MSDISVLIPSCDAFADVHAPFLACFERYWPDCPWPMYGLSESGWGPEPIPCEKDESWVHNLLFALGWIEEEFALMFLDDMLLCEPVDQTAVDKASHLIQRDEIGAVRIGPGAEVCDTSSDDKLVGRIMRDSRYRISTSPTLWRKRYLDAVLRGSGAVTAWDFEIKGTQFARTHVTPESVLKILDMPPPIQVLYTAITRGEWEKGAIDWLGRVGIEVGDRSRPMRKDSAGTGWPE